MDWTLEGAVLPLWTGGLGRPAMVSPVHECAI
jgi:hypothetical protein